MSHIQKTVQQRGAIIAAAGFVLALIALPLTVGGKSGLLVFVVYLVSVGSVAIAYFTGRDFVDTAQFAFAAVVVLTGLSAILNHTNVIGVGVVIVAGLVVAFGTNQLRKGMSDRL